ncbi:MAG: type II toxin-antitoxin system RelE/ParE family toxin [Bacteroidetes bacterium]|nr:type II toxin-antitoxin system RelE/ParE family toxin [Bacteroidota bacterium]
MYQLLIEKQVQKQLEKIPVPDYQRVKTAITDLAKNPRPDGYKKLKGRPGYRIRQGNYRVVYDINDHILTVFILAAGHRKDIYE